jgi:hypothetical protein
MHESGIKQGLDGSKDQGLGKEVIGFGSWSDE